MVLQATDVLGNGSETSYSRNWRCHQQSGCFLFEIIYFAADTIVKQSEVKTKIYLRCFFPCQVRHTDLHGDKTGNVGIICSANQTSPGIVTNLSVTCFTPACAEFQETEHI